jgi:hypothetical protein
VTHAISWSIPVALTLVKMVLLAAIKISVTSVAVLTASLVTTVKSIPFAPVRMVLVVLQMEAHVQLEFVRATSLALKIQYHLLSGSSFLIKSQTLTVVARITALTVQKMEALITRAVVVSVHVSLRSTLLHVSAILRMMETGVKTNLISVLRPV